MLLWKPLVIRSSVCSITNTLRPLREISQAIEQPIIPPPNYYYIIVTHCHMLYPLTVIGRLGGSDDSDRHARDRAAGRRLATDPETGGPATPGAHPGPARLPLSQSPRISFNRFFSAVMRSFILSERAALDPRFFGAAAAGRATTVGRGAWQYEQPLFIPCLHSVIETLSLVASIPDARVPCRAMSTSSAQARPA